MHTPLPNDKPKGRQHPPKRTYKRDPADLEQAPKKPKKLAKKKSLNIRFTQSEWDGLLTKATLGGNTITNIIRAGALGLEVKAVVSREWTAEERVEYRALVNGMNKLNQLTKAVNLTAPEQGQVQELYDWMRKLLAELVPPRIV